MKKSQPKRPDYSAEQVTKALLALVANRGNVSATAEELIDDEFQVPVSTLRAWKNDRYAEQYRRLEDKHGKEMEAIAVEMARSNLHLAGEKKRALLERIDPAKVSPDQLAATLKAVTDAEAKSTTGLLQLTGRPTNPTGDQSSGEVVKLLQTMADKGFLALAPGVSLDVPQQNAKAIESTAQEEEA